MHATSVQWNSKPVLPFPHSHICTFAAIQGIAEAPHYYIWSLLAFNFSPGDRGNFVKFSEGENKGNPKGTVISLKLLETPAEIVLDPD